MQGACPPGGSPGFMPMMQQPVYPQQMPMQGSLPPGYVQQQQPYYGQQQPSYGQPAIQTGGGYASSDRLPPIPDMMRRPATPPPTEPRQPIVRGAAPEQSKAVAASPPPPAAPAWTPIRIPTPNEMGITPVAISATPPPSTVSLPDRYDLGTVTTWLDKLGARSCQRERLAEGVQFVCTFGANIPAITVRGNTDEEALQKLVQEVVRRQQETTRR